MGEDTAIEWASHTFNPWRGCVRVSPGCENCYAERGSKRNPKVLGVWGVNGTRVVASEAMWRQPLKWNAAAEAAGKRALVFCASLADVGEDRPDLVAPRARLCELIKQTPWLFWLLLTKRIKNMARLFPSELLEHCGVGTTTEDQPRAEKRIGILLQTPAAVRFISAEPLLGDVDLNGLPDPHSDPSWDASALHGLRECAFGATVSRQSINKLDWVIAGGESGPGARPCCLSWLRNLAHDCELAGVPFFLKQLGARPYETTDDDGADGECRWPIGQELELSDPKGGDPDEWPANVPRTRQFPSLPPVSSTIRPTTASATVTSG